MIKFKTKNILGVKIADVTLSEIVPIIEGLIKSSGKKIIIGANPYAINLYQVDKEFKRALDCATFIYPEGTGTVIASKLLGKPLSGRTTLLDYIFDIIKIAELKKWSIYILGGESSVSKSAIANLKKRFPNLIINGHHGYFEKKETEKIITSINKKKAKILFVAMGSPKQEVWIERHVHKLNVKALFGIGGSIDIIAGQIPRAPMWMRKGGLEWLYRTYKEPVRLWRRYLIGNITFMLRVGNWVLFRK